MHGIPLSQAQTTAPKRDFDWKTEQKSQFWELALHPNRILYDQYMDSITKRIRSMHNTNLGGLVSDLIDAIALEPHNPRGYWYLSIVRQRQEDWEACVELRRRALAEDPNFVPPRIYNTPNDAQVGLGLCQNLAGKLSESTKLFERLQRSNHPSQEVAWRLGEAYMAQGRIREAIETLEVLTQLQRRIPRDLSIALAVAYDRDDRTLKSQQRLHLFHQRRWRAQPKHFSRVTPLGDRFYYAGLVNKHTGYPNYAIAYFRHFLHAMSHSVWVSKAKFHVEQLRRSNSFGPVTMRGIDKSNQDRITLAMQRAYPQLEQCIATTPDLLVLVHVSGGTTSKPPTIRANADYKFSSTEKQSVTALRCIEQTAHHISFPNISRSGWNFTFSLIFKDTP